ncbi:hypothetical protein FRB99_000055 [Tulasnella sp. 403]|nr:hypothetical protein FRB99_000055 [Tulasnella sp. 403]
MVRLVNSLRSSGVPFDGVGSQCHLSAGAASGVQGALQALAATSVTKDAITERIVLRLLTTPSLPFKLHWSRIEILWRKGLRPQSGVKDEFRIAVTPSLYRPT